MTTDDQLEAKKENTTLISPGLNNVLMLIIFTISIFLSMKLLEVATSRQSIINQINQMQLDILKKISNTPAQDKLSALETPLQPSASAPSPGLTPRAIPLESRSLLEILDELDKYKTIATSIDFAGENRVSASCVTYYLNNIKIRQADMCNSGRDSYPYFIAPENYSTNSVILITMVLTSGIGSILSSIKQGRPFSSSTYIGGLGSGFLAFLVIRGGKFLLIGDTLQLGGELNPYGMALTGLIVGLFSVLAHQVLTSVVEALAQRVLSSTTTSDAKPRETRSEE